MAQSPTTKSAKLKNMLARPNGASLDALCKATGWQKHSVRAAIPSVRKAGHTVIREANGDKGPVYRLVATESDSQ
ncbi:DUF3489 domain-containing protein [Silicimonas algicola]|uniref:Uncharacterized protein DUF3489 n=1 Tax=Silicimonas algicola TaxID=1826607 RepID=A0A316G1U6_9RHOB|nr:DUF3489 domain-containing protein [Silicimonas algicola]PWK54603.1 uncharacterized protein DUF3489 [Silicimonas algicola]